MSQIDPHLPDTADRQLVRFHLDYDSPGGYIATISQDPDPDVDPGFGMWIFYADEQPVATGEHLAPGQWAVQVTDQAFVKAHKITDRQLELLFEQAVRGTEGPYQALTCEAPTIRHSEIGVITSGPKPNDAVVAPHNGFALDRVALADSLGAAEEQDEDCGIQQFGETPVEQIAGAFLHAEESKALRIPDGVDLYALKLTPAADSVILAIRETHEAASSKAAARQAAGLPSERQIASWTIDTGWLSDTNDQTFLGLCQTIENICETANGLMPVLRALLDGEDMLLALIATPLTVLTYNNRGRFTTYRASVVDATEGDVDHAKLLWPLLIEALDRGEASEDWDGERQRAFHLQPRCERHLVRQLVELRDGLVTHGKATLRELPDPDGGFEQHLA
jgi:hypothetical protein